MYGDKTGCMIGWGTMGIMGIMGYGGIERDRVHGSGRFSFIRSVSRAFGGRAGQGTT